MNFYSGKIEASGDTTLIIQRKSESRFGVIANAGADIKLNKKSWYGCWSKICFN